MLGHQRPGQGLVFLFRRPGQDLQLGDRLTALSDRRADTVGTGVAAADDDDVLAGCGDGRVGRNGVAGNALVLLRQEVHRKMYAVQIAARDRQIPRLLGSAGQGDRVEGLQQFLCADIGTDVAGGPEGNAFGLHLLDAAVDKAFFHFEVGNAIAQQSADAVALFEQGYIMTGTRELLRAGHARRARTHDSDLFAGLVCGDLRRNPAVLPGLVDDGALNGLDGDGFILQVERTGFLAGRRADPAGELGEVIGRVQYADRAPPLAFPHQVVPVGDEVVDRAALVTERNAAVHAARALRA